MNQMDQQELGKRVWCLRHLTSEEFFLAAVAACEAVRDFFKAEALGRGLANYGRNNQIYDSWARHARELAQAIEFTKYDDYGPIREAASDVSSTNRGITQWVFMGWLGEAEPEYHHLAGIAGQYARDINNVLESGLVDGLYWLEDAPNESSERHKMLIGCGGKAFINKFFGGPDGEGKFPADNYPHLRNHPIPQVFPRYEPDTSRPVKTGEIVPWTGIWIPESEVKEGEDNWIWPHGDCEITPTIWYPLIEVPAKDLPLVQRIEGGQPCSRDGY
jgi:hypothetical protein